MNHPSTSAAQVRVAIYTRKSTEEGLDQVFNTLDAQRESVEAYVKSQAGEGWAALPATYDDGGFSGASTKRPAFQQLLRDVRDGNVDVVAVYKIDRLSRSLSDFARIMEFFEEHGVTFVSITQQFNTTTSMGKLTLNVLMSFAEFERETIAERTRDKMAATRRRGQWTGGRPVLGYDLVDKHLVVNATEAEQVRLVFELFQVHASCVSVSKELNHRGIRKKVYTTKTGRRVGGKAWDAPSVRYVLNNPVYRGMVFYEGIFHEGRHDPIVDEHTWRATQDQLSVAPRKRPAQGSKSILAGLVHCARCDAAMTPHHARKGSRRYEYYVCQTYLKKGAAACPAGRVSAVEIERGVMRELRRHVNAHPPPSPKGANDVVRSKAKSAMAVHDSIRSAISAWPALVQVEKRRMLCLLLQEVRFDPSERTVFAALQSRW